jgi:hypothetical protein
MTSFVFRPRPKSIQIVLLTIFSATTLYADSPAQTLSEALGQGEMLKVRTAINGGGDVNNRDADDTTSRMEAPYMRRGWRRRFCRRGVSNE